MSEHHKENFITKYVFSMDHKMIAKQFLLTGMFMAVVGMLMSAIFRVQLANPGESSILYNLLPSTWLNDAGGLNPDKYLALVTMHGTILVFWVLTAGLSGTFANFLIPLQIGARDMASGFLNMLSYWFFFIATVVLMSSLFVESGPASGGWTIYPPLSALPQAIPGSGTGMTLWLISITLFVVGSLLGGLNYIVTILNLRTIGMTMKRLPLTVWALLITAILGVLSFPVLLSCGLLISF
jgi:cytochrome c oxidase subunit 1